MSACAPHYLKVTGDHERPLAPLTYLDVLPTLYGHYRMVKYAVGLLP